jgi:hypothetical protein
MNIPKSLILLLITTFLVSTSASQAQNPPKTLVTPSKVRVYWVGQLKSYHITELTASDTTCDSTDSYSFMVSWKPVFRDWNLPPGAGPYIWKHYLASNLSHCQQSIIMCGDPACTMKFSNCPVTVAYGLVRIQTYFDETETGRGSWVQIGGIPRPTLTYDYDDRRWKCLGGAL